MTDNVTGFPCRRLLRELCQHGGHRGQLPCRILAMPPCLPSFICWT